MLGVGCAAGSPRGRWVLGVGRWVLYRAATTRSPDGILCRASLDVVLKHPSSWRRDPWGFIFGRWVFGRWVLGVGRWVLGVGCAAGSPPGVESTTRSLYRDFDGPFGSPDRGHHDGIVAVAVSALQG